MEAGNRLSIIEWMKEARLKKRRNDSKMERKAIATMMMLAFLALTLVPVQTVSAKTLKFDQVLTLFHRTMI